MKNNNKIVVSKYPLIKDLLVHLGHIPEDTPYFRGVNVKEITGKHVYGNVPGKFAHLPDKITTVHIRNNRQDKDYLNSLDNLIKSFVRLSTRRTEIVDD